MTCAFDPEPTGLRLGRDRVNQAHSSTLGTLTHPSTHTHRGANSPVNWYQNHRKCLKSVRGLSATGHSQCHRWDQLRAVIIVFCVRSQRSSSFVAPSVHICVETLESVPQVEGWLQSCMVSIHQLATLTPEQLGTWCTQSCWIPQTSGYTQTHTHAYMHAYSEKVEQNTHLQDVTEEISAVTLHLLLANRATQVKRTLRRACSSSTCDLLRH